MYNFSLKRLTDHSIEYLLDSFAVGVYRIALWSGRFCAGYIFMALSTLTFARVGKI